MINRMDNFYPIKKTRSIPNWVVLVFAFLFLGAGVMLIFKNPFQMSSQSDAEKIAVIKNINQNTQRKITGTMNWIEASKGDDLFHGDQILTDDNSSATITFNDNSEILIGPQSLIKLEMNNNEFKIELTKGKVQFTQVNEEAKTKIKVVEKSTGKVTVVRKAQEIKTTRSIPKPKPIVFTPPPPRVTKVVEPVVEVKPEPIPEPVAPPPPPVVEKPKPVKKKPVVVKPKVLEAPAIIVQQIMEFSGDDKKPSYKIKLLPHPDAKRYFTEVYTDSALQKPILKVSTAKPEYEWPSARSGKYFYRVRIQDEAGKFSPYSQTGTLAFPISPFEEF